MNTRTVMGTGRGRLALWLSLLLAASVVAPTAVIAAPRPKTGPCVVSAGVTYSSRNTVVTGTSGADTIDCSASRKAMTIIGGGGGDDIIGSRGGDTIYGDLPTTPAQSCDQSNSGADRIEGGPGNDVIRGSVCGSSSRGGPGDDQFVATGGTNSFNGDDGNDTIDMRGASAYAWGTGWSVTAVGGLGNDTIFLGPLGGVAYGDEGNDALVGGDAADLLDAGPGDDSLEGNGGNDILNGGEGVDQLFGGDGDDNLSDASPEADIFNGGANDTTTPPLPRPGPGQSGAWGDVCSDGDGRGTAPGDPDGSGQVGAISPIQNDTISGCEYLFVDPAL